MAGRQLKLRLIDGLREVWMRTFAVRIRSSYLYMSRSARACQNPRFEQHVVARGYFETLSVPILRGRPFRDLDTEHSPPVVMINEPVARLEFPDTDSVGKQIRIGSDGRGEPSCGPRLILSVTKKESPLPNRS